MGALIIDSDRILLVERGRQPLQGWWSLPGGVLEVGERIEFALRREVREETGLEVEVHCLLELFERIMPDAEGKPEYHYVLADYVCTPAGGQLLAADDASKAEWVRECDLGNYKITDGTPEVIAKAFAWLREAKLDKSKLDESKLESKPDESKLDESKLRGTSSTDPVSTLAST